MNEELRVPLAGRKLTSHILPFLWMKGEGEETVLDEIEKIAECGIREICLESRPHPDFCGPGWWKILSVILPEARRRGMRVWILDDSRFPTGHANGGFQKHPELAKWYLAERHMDILGPCRESAVLIQPFLPGDAELLGVLAFPKPDTDTLAVSPDGVLDLTDGVKDGFVYFDLPEGAYRLFVLFTTQTGGGRPLYMNLIDSDSVRVQIDEVYETHYAHFSRYFGSTIAGFFSDEPELGNEPGYPFDAVLGKRDVRLPWSWQLRERLQERFGPDFRKNLPALWYEAGERTGSIREAYMDEVTKLVYTCFTAQIGRWCREHSVEYIGHIIEDANASSRLGCSIGHYFREMHGRDMAGIDVVHHQIVPGFTGKIHQWIAGDEDGEFFHYGMCRLASGEAHIDPKKKNRALVELYGNYGWAEGVSLMRWLANHMLVSGIREFVPHAFSMTYPDPDCPPHFYARGNNPQFADFAWLMRSLQRAASLLSKTRPEVPAAVLYHAESEWACGKREGAGLFQRPARELLRRQIDCDVIPEDVLREKAAAPGTESGAEDTGYGTPGGPGASVTDGKLRIGEMSYSCLVLPEMTVIAREAAEFLISAAEKGLPVFALNRKPERDFDGKPLPEKFADSVICVPEDQLADAAAAAVKPAAVLKGRFPDLRLCSGWTESGKIAMFFNESVTRPVDTEVRWNWEDSQKPLRAAVLYDAWSDTAETVPVTDGRMALKLDPGQAVMVLLSADTPAPSRVWKTREEIRLEGPFAVSRADELHPAEFVPYTTVQGSLLPSMNGPAYDPSFTGWYRYGSAFRVKTEPGERVILRIPAGGDAVLISVNGKEAGRLAGFPSEIEITDAVRDGENSLTLQFSTTLVWKRKDGASTHLQLGGTGLLEAPVLKILREEEAASPGQPQSAYH
ncbi:MAG: hypothetical protein ACOX8B_03670 [Lachnospiraceae bacterium]